MLVSEFLGKKVLDKNAIEVGKVSDMDIDLENGMINSVIISKGELVLRPQTFIVNIDEIQKVGDYVIIDIAVEEVSETHGEEMTKLSLGKEE
ncbi:MAG: PRC-barrel domain-containing protein [Methanobacteriaceae archaeon]|nr:PRC-barrel domain-containing protein [Methanobacteriaceae archaeon]